MTVFNYCHITSHKMYLYVYTYYTLWIYLIKLFTHLNIKRLSFMKATVFSETEPKQSKIESRNNNQPCDYHKIWVDSYFIVFFITNHYPEDVPNIDHKKMIPLNCESILLYIFSLIFAQWIKYLNNLMYLVIYTVFSVREIICLSNQKDAVR